MKASEYRKKVGLVTDDVKIKRECGLDTDCFIRSTCITILRTYPTIRKAAEATGINPVKVHRILSYPNREIKLSDVKRILKSSGREIVVVHKYGDGKNDTSTI